MSNEQKKSETLEVRMSLRTKTDLQARATRNGRTMSEIARGLIEQYLYAPPDTGCQDGWLRSKLRRYPRLIAASVMACLSLSIVPIMTASAEPTEVHLKGEIGEQSEQVRHRVGFETTLRLDAGEKAELPLRNSPYVMTLRLGEARGDTYDLFFSIVEAGEGGKVLLEPRLISANAEPARLKIDRPNGMFIDLTAHFANDE